jgi:predicted ATPase/DNA-binding SARP family transcriptional activator
MRFGILGPFEVADDQRRKIALGGRKQQAVLAILVLHAGEVVSSDRLIEELWGDRAPATAAKTLQIYVSKLRKALGDGVVLTRAGGYVLDLDRADVDVYRFEALVVEGRQALASDPGRAARCLADALTLWRGQPLAEFLYEPFAQGELPRLEEARLAALEDRIDADLALGAHAALVGELESLVREHPLRERLRGQLMLALYRAGRQAEALEVYQRARVHLAEELGLEPGPALKALQAQILDQAPALQQGVEDRTSPPAPHPSSRRVPSSTTPTSDGEPAEMLPQEQVWHAGRTAKTRPVNRLLPRPPTVTIGRAREVQAVCAALEDPHILLVTLLGPGGVGKTRLALEVAHALQASTPDGVYWIELAGVARPEDVGATIARALSVVPAPGEGVAEALTRFLATKRLLLVADNFEHVLTAADLLAELLRACSDLKILATSREALSLSAEHRFPVSPLTLPAVSDRVPVAEVEKAPATALFLAAARRLDNGFTLTPATAPLIAQICARLDGLPLAIELAAARTELFGIETLAAGLASFGDLGKGPRDAPARQRTLAATIDWSYRLLDPAQQTAFVRFAVFAGGATLEAAQAVTGANVEVLEELIAKHLVGKREGYDGSPRLMMLETLRQYASERLAGDPDRKFVQHRHFESYIQLVENAVPRLYTHADADAMATIEQDIDNIGLALRWALAHEPDSSLRLVGMLGEYWWLTDELDGLQWIDAALEAADEHAPLEDRAHAELARAYQLTLGGRIEAAHDAAAAALGMYERAGDERAISLMMVHLSLYRSWLGDPDGARAWADGACRRARLTGDRALLGKVLAISTGNIRAEERQAVLEEAAGLLIEAGDYRHLQAVYTNYGYAALKDGEVEEALRLFERAQEVSPKGTSPWLEVGLLDNMAFTSLMAGDSSRARKLYASELKLAARHGVYGLKEFMLASVGALAVSQNDLKHGARLLGAARTFGYPPAGEKVLVEWLERDFFARGRASLGEDAWREAEQIGASLSHDEAIALAREVVTDVPESWTAAPCAGDVLTALDATVLP